MKRFCVAFAMVLGCAVGAVTAQTTNGANLADGALKAAAAGDPTGAASEAARGTGMSQDARAAYAAQIVQKWSKHAQKAYKVAPQAWNEQITALFKVASPAMIKEAVRARSFDDMIAAIHPDLLARGQPNSALKVLGDIDKDLVFVPVAPCRIFDTRAAGGIIAGNTVRQFDITAVTDYAFQGGVSNNCGGVGAAGSFAAAAINFTVVNSTNSGFLVAYPFLGVQPFSATMVYGINDLISNLAIVKLDQGASSNEMSVYTSTTTHLVGDIVGYYTQAVASQPDCVETFSSNITVNANSTGTGSSPACAAGYQIMSGGCTMSTFDGRIVSSRTFRNSNTHFCAFRNENVSASNIGVVYGTCCKW